jgi:hypothetical protein
VAGPAGKSKDAIASVVDEIGARFRQVLRDRYAMVDILLLNEYSSEEYDGPGSIRIVYLIIEYVRHSSECPVYRRIGSGRLNAVLSMEG